MDYRSLCRTALLAVCTTLLPVLALARQTTQDNGRPALQRRQESHAVLAHQKLNPPLRSGNRRVRYSPDGKYILLQDDSGIRLFTREPLEQRFYVAATRVLPAAFSADSQNVVIATAVPEAATFSVNGDGKADAKPLSSTLKACVSARLSPTGSSLACLDITFKLHLLEIPGGREILSSQILTLPPGVFGWERLSTGSAFSEPFGYIMTDAPSFLSGREPSINRLVFSRGGRYLLTPGFAGELAAFDVTNGQKASVPGSFRRRAPSQLQFPAADQVALVDPQKPEESELVSFTTGKTLTKLNLPGPAQDTTAPGYLVYRSKDNSSSFGLWDLKAERSIVKLTDFAADVYGREVATYTPEGNLEIQSLDDSDGSKQKTVDVSPGLLPMMRVASVSPDLDYIALGTGGEGAVFRTADGKRVGSFDNVRSGWCDASSSCFLRTSVQEPGDFTVKKVLLTSADASDAWSRRESGKSRVPYAPYNEYFSSAAVTFLHAAKINPENFLSFALATRGTTRAMSAMAGFSLGVLDTQTGNELWKRDFETDAPVPFSDPQGDRFVLGWNAKSSGGKHAMRDNKAASEALKHDKESKKDSYFEVVDPRTGNTIGGALLQLDSEPEEFDSAFSEGDWLVLAKDGQRVFVYSLSSGEQILKVFGWRPTINAATASLCLSTAPNRLTTYDLKTARKMRDYNSLVDIAYAHYSADGQRLLVLTSDQMVYLTNVGRDSAVPKAN